MCACVCEKVVVVEDGSEGTEEDGEPGSQDHDAQELEQAQRIPLLGGRRGQSAGGAPRARARRQMARRGLQVPARPAASIQPPRPLKGSGNRSRRVAEAFALPPRLGGGRSGLGGRLLGLQDLAAPRGCF